MVQIFWLFRLFRAKLKPLMRSYFFNTVHHSPHQEHFDVNQHCFNKFLKRIINLIFKWLLTVLLNILFHDCYFIVKVYLQNLNAGSNYCKRNMSGLAFVLPVMPQFLFEGALEEGYRADSALLPSAPQQVMGKPCIVLCQLRCVFRDVQCTD